MFLQVSGLLKYWPQVTDCKSYCKMSGPDLATEHLKEVFPMFFFLIGILE